MLKVFGLSVLSGLLLAFSWPTNGFIPLIFFAFIPLFFLHEFVLKFLKWHKISVFFLSFITFLIFNGFTTGWISQVQPSGLFAVTAALIINAGLMSLVSLFGFLCRKHFGLNKGLRCFLVLWLMFEFLHLDWDLSWPWLTLGNVFSEKTNWIQWYEYTGVFGGSLWILLINILMFKYIHEGLNKRTSWILSLFIPLLIFLPISISKIIEKRIHFPSDFVTISIVQPNQNPYEAKFSKSNIEHTLEMLELVDLSNNKVDYVLSPETALPDGMWEEKMDTYSSIRLLNTYAKKYPKTHFVFGGLTFKKYSIDENVPYTARNKKDVWYDVYNSAIQVDSSNNIQIYHKSKLVPGTEIMPFIKRLDFMKKLFLNLGGTTGSLGRQNNREIFKSNNKKIKVAPVICYESIYGEYVGNYINSDIINTNEGANLIFILTNDGWWGDTQGHKQHASYAKIRSIETRRSIVRSANTGISCFINLKGEFINKIDWDTKGVITKKMPINNKITFYVKFGDYIGRIATFIGVFYLLNLLVFIRIKK